MVQNAKSLEFSEGNLKCAWERFVDKYASHIASSLLKLKREFQKSKLDSIKKDYDKCISNLEGLWIQMTEFGSKGNISEECFMINIFTNLPKEYDGISDGLKSYLMSSGLDRLRIDVVHKKVNRQYKK